MGQDMKREILNMLLMGVVGKMLQESLTRGCNIKQKEKAPEGNVKTHQSTSEYFPVQQASSARER